MFVATLMSFLACTRACWAEFLSKPMETSVAIESSGGSIADGMEERIVSLKPKEEISYSLSTNDAKKWIVIMKEPSHL